MKPVSLKSSSQQLELLDWEIIVARVSQQCFFEHVRKDFVHKPFLTFSSIPKELDLLEVVSSSFDTLKSRFFENLNGCPSDHKHIDEVFKVGKGHVLDNFQLNIAAHFVEIFQRCSKILSPEMIHQEASLSTQGIYRNFIKPVRSFIDPEGTIHFDKHPLLSQITAQIDSLDKNLRNRVIQILAEEPYLSCIQFSQYDIVNERYVVPIKSDSYNASLGPIISRSKSGMTLLVEPFELRELSNRRMQLTAQRDEILNDIFIKLSEQLNGEINLFKQIIYYVSKIDLLLAKAHYGLSHHFCRPTISSYFSLEIQDFFHPLIPDPITNSISFSEDTRGLVISGPNTGGKTVALKSLALCCTFMNAGMFTPARSARLPLINELYYFSHDQQDLTQGLSSFSSEANQYIELSKNISDYSFVFIDEIFNSTSSEEASALALSLIDYLHSKRKIKIFLSTHHQLLKTSLQTYSSYISAHVGFDFQQKKPTYKLQLGSPGSSMALSIFENLCHENNELKSISTKAQKILDEKHVSYEKLLEQVSAQKTTLDREVQEAHLLRRDLEDQKKSSEGILYLERQTIRDSYKKEFDKLFKSAQQWFNDLKENSTRQPIRTKALEKNIYAQKNKFLSKFSSSVQKNNASSESNLVPIDSIYNIKERQTLYCNLMNSRVQVLKLNYNKEKIQVLHGHVKAWVPLSALFLTSQSIKEQDLKQKVEVHVEKTVTGKLELDVRGQRLSECQSNILQALDELLCGDIPYLNIIHGHGDGVLKKWIREHLSLHRDDFSWEASKDHDGSTLVKIQD